MMVVITKEGYFKNGAFFEGVPPLPVVNAMLRTKPCWCLGSCGNYLDYSYSIQGLYFSNRPEQSYVIFHGILEGELLIEWEPRFFPGRIKLLPWYWNDGNWIEYLGPE